MMNKAYLPILFIMVFTVSHAAVQDSSLVGRGTQVPKSIKIKVVDTNIDTTRAICGATASTNCISDIPDCSNAIVTNCRSESGLGTGTENCVDLCIAREYKGTPLTAPIPLNVGSKKEFSHVVQIYAKQEYSPAKCPTMYVEKAVLDVGYQYRYITSGSYWLLQEEFPGTRVPKHGPSVLLCARMDYYWEAAPTVSGVTNASGAAAVPAITPTVNPRPPVTPAPPITPAPTPTQPTQPTPPPTLEDQCPYDCSAPNPPNCCYWN